MKLGDADVDMLTMLLDPVDVSEDVGEKETRLEAETLLDCNADTDIDVEPVDERETEADRLSIEGDEEGVLNGLVLVVTLNDRLDQLEIEDEALTRAVADREAEPVVERSDDTDGDTVITDVVALALMVAREADADKETCDEREKSAVCEIEMLTAELNVASEPVGRLEGLTDALPLAESFAEAV